MQIFDIALTDDQEAEVQETAADLESEGLEGWEADDLAETLFILSHQVVNGVWVDLVE